MASLYVNMSHIEVEPIVDAEVYVEPYFDYMDYVYILLIMIGIICLFKNLKS